jgi:DEAD/DEAH box helicase domain-containing protein
MEQLSSGRAATPAPTRPNMPVSTGNTDRPQPDYQLPARFGVFDVETQRSAQEVGGWHRADLMRVSVAVLYESDGDRFTSFTEETLAVMIDRLFALDLVVGFNNKRFDNKVLSAYTNRDLSRLPSFDILEAISTRLGYRLSLDRLAATTLGVSKDGDGLQALRWFKQGAMDKLAEYCRKDVEITRDLFLFGLRQQHLLFRNKAGKAVRLPVDFAESLRTMQQRLQDFTARPDPCAPSR